MRRDKGQECVGKKIQRTSNWVGSQGQGREKDGESQSLFLFSSLLSFFSFYVRLLKDGQESVCL